MAAPMMLTPVTSKAGDGDTYYNQIHRDRSDAVWDWFRARDVRDGRGWLDRGRELRDPFDSRPRFGPGAQGTPGNSVPLDQGTVLLLIAGLGLGFKMLYDRRKKVENSVIRA